MPPFWSTITHNAMCYLEAHFHSEDAREDVIKVVEDHVAIRVLCDGIFCGEGNTTGTDDDHDKQIKVS